MPSTIRAQLCFNYYTQRGARLPDEASVGIKETDWNRRSRRLEDSLVSHDALHASYLPAASVEVEGRKVEDRLEVR